MQTNPFSDDAPDGQNDDIFDFGPGYAQVAQAQQEPEDGLLDQTGISQAQRTVAAAMVSNTKPVVNSPYPLLYHESDELEDIFQQQKAEILRKLSSKKQMSAGVSIFSQRRDLRANNKGFTQLEGLQELEEVLKTEDGIVVLQIYTAWAWSVEQHLPTFTSQFPQVRFFKMDLDKNMEIGVRYDFWRVPTFLFFSSEAYAGKVAYEEDVKKFEQEFKTLYEEVKSNETQSRLAATHSELVDYIRSRHEEESKTRYLLEACNFLESREVYWPKALEIIQEVATEGKPDLLKALAKLRKVVSPADQMTIAMMCLALTNSSKQNSEKAQQSPANPIAQETASKSDPSSANPSQGRMPKIDEQISAQDLGEYVTDIILTLSGESQQIEELSNQIFDLVGQPEYGDDVLKVVRSPGIQAKIKLIPELDTKLRKHSKYW